MARPTEKSLYSFPHDTDARGDRKHKLFIRYTGLPGYGFYWAILEDIYNEHYYIEWTNEDREAFIAEFHSPFYEIDEEGVDYLIQQALKFGLLDKELYEKFNILTSRSIQARWLKQSSRRVLAKMRKDFVLINLPEFYEKELKTANLSIKIMDEDGETEHIYGDYEESDNGNGVSGGNNQDNVDNYEDTDDEPEPEWDEKYDFSCTYMRKDGQPIDYTSCIEDWNKITGGQAWTTNIPKSKKKDLKRVFRNYAGKDVYYGMIARAKDERLADSKYLTDWSTLFGAKKLENLDKWVDRGREWIQTQSSIETVAEHLENGWLTQKDYYELCERQGIDPDEPMWCSTKKVESQLLYYPEFSH